MQGRDMPAGRDRVQQIEPWELGALTAPDMVDLFAVPFRRSPDQEVAFRWKTGERDPYHESNDVGVEELGKNERVVSHPDVGRRDAPLVLKPFVHRVFRVLRIPLFPRAVLETEIVIQLERDGHIRANPLTLGYRPAVAK